MASSPLHQVAIAGAFNTQQARVLNGETSQSITLKAALGALADAGLTPKDVDGVTMTAGMSGALISQYWVHLFGGNACWTGGGGLAGIQSVLEAAAAIAAGYCSTVVVANGQAGAYTTRESTAPWTRPSH